MVMPLFDDGPTARSMRPYVTYGLIAANVIIFFCTAKLDTDAENAFVNAYGMTPALVAGHGVSGGAFSPWLTLLTHQFLHADILHLLSNMIFLWVFGDNIEDAMGQLRFLAFYLLCGVLGGLAQMASDTSSTIPMVGASGAVSGVIAAYLLVRPCAKVGVFYMLIVVQIPAYWVAGIFMFAQLLAVAGGTDDGIGYWSHLGGLAAGAMLFPLMRYRHVPLFECIERSEGPPPPPMPDASHLRVRRSAD